jgi:four helix bundle protein
MGKVQDWKVKEMARTQQEMVFRLTRLLPQEEKFSLIDQVRRSSRSVSANIAEAYAKRRYAPAMVAKLTDADGENAEIKVWLDIVLDCHYMAPNDLATLLDLKSQINRLLNYMMIHKENFMVKI